MAFDIWARAVTKWRGILVYVLLQAVFNVVTRFIYARAETPGLRLYASVVGVSTGLFCLVQLLVLLTRDSEGDEAWPRLWS